MTIETLKGRLPDYARDLRLNLSNLAADPSLSDVQRAGTFIACAIASRDRQVIEAMIAEFGPALTAEQLTAAKAAAAIMGMNNIYYRFTHLTSNPEYGKLPAKLRMNIIANPGAEKKDFELWSLAVSAINGCGMCVDSHERVLREHAVSTEQIQTAVRIAAVVHAVAATIEGEGVLQTALAEAA